MSFGSGSYYEEYLRQKAMKQPPFGMTSSTPKTFLTDRNAYISYLEVQLEKISSACLNTRQLEKQIQEMESTVHHLQDKIQSLTKITKLSQNLHEEKQHEHQTFQHDTIQKLNGMGQSIDKYHQDLIYLRDRQTTMEEHERTFENRFQQLLKDQTKAMENKFLHIQEQVEKSQHLFHERKHKENLFETQNQDLKQEIMKIEQRIQENHAKDMELLKVNDQHWKDTYQKQLTNQDEKLKKLKMHLEQSQSIEIARISCSFEEHMEKFQIFHEKIQQQQLQLQNQVSKLTLSTQEKQRLIQTQLTKHQEEIEKYESYLSNLPPGTLSDHILIKLEQQIHTIENQLENHLKEIQNEIQKKFYQQQQSTYNQLQIYEKKTHKAEETCLQLAHESIQRHEKQGEKVLESLNQIEKRVKREMEQILFKNEAMENSTLEMEERLKKWDSNIETFQNQINELKHSTNMSTKEIEDAYPFLKKEILKQLYSFQISMESNIQTTLEQKMTSLRNELQVNLNTEGTDKEWKELHLNNVLNRMTNFMNTSENKKEDFHLQLMELKKNQRNLFNKFQKIQESNFKDFKLQASNMNSPTSSVCSRLFHLSPEKQEKLKTEDLENIQKTALDHYDDINVKEEEEMPSNLIGSLSKKNRKLSLRNPNFTKRISIPKKEMRKKKEHDKPVEFQKRKSTIKKKSISSSGLKRSMSLHNPSTRQQKAIQLKKLYHQVAILENQLDLNMM